MTACIVPGCINREGEGRFEGPLCSPCAEGLRSNGTHEHDAASKIIAAALRGRELEDKILALGREAKHVDTIVADDISNGLHKIPRGHGTTWYAQGPEERDV